MYQKQTYVMHKSEGVCLVEDVRTERFPKTTPREYYILRPVYGNTATTVFLPVDSGEARLRPLLDEEQLAQTLSTSATGDPLWESNDRLRQEKFHRLIHEAQPSVLYRLSVELRQHREQQSAQGKKLRFFDEQALQDAERLLAQEAAHVWKIDLDAALAQIRNV